MKKHTEVLVVLTKTIKLSYCRWTRFWLDYEIPNVKLYVFIPLDYQSAQ